MNCRLDKGDPYRARLNVEGNLIVYPGDCKTPKVDLITVKLFLNSVTSTPDAKFMTINI